jgi:hypothetical protein
MKSTAYALACAFAFAPLVTAGCDSKEEVTVTKTTTVRTSTTTESAGDKVERAADKTGNVIEKGAEKTGEALNVAWVRRQLLERHPCARIVAIDHIEWCSEGHVASTFVPTAPMTAIAATTIRPAIRAYSSTSPPCSSFTNLVKIWRNLFIFGLLATGSRDDRNTACA